MKNREYYLDDLKDDEKKLIEHFGGPVWVIYYDEDAAPFYQRSINGKAQNADLLMGIGETVGCGERWSNGAELDEALKHHKIKKNRLRMVRKIKKFPTYADRWVRYGDRKISTICFRKERY